MAERRRIGCVWEINGTTTIGAAVVGNPGPSWHAKGSGDFNGDGRADILWQNDSGEVVIWEMNGTAVIGGVERSWSTVGLYRLRGERIAACWLLPLDPAQFDEIWAGP